MSENKVVIVIENGAISQIAANHDVSVTVLDTDVQEPTGKTYCKEPVQVIEYDLTPDDDTVTAILVDVEDDTTQEPAEQG